MKVCILTAGKGTRMGAYSKIINKSLLPIKNKAIVKGVNIVKKHQKPDKKSGGGIIEKELPVHISNLSFISIKDGKKTKIGYKIENNKKIRFEKKTGEVIKNV